MPEQKQRQKTKREILIKLIQEGKIYWFNARFTRNSVYSKYFQRTRASKSITINCAIICDDSFLIDINKSLARPYVSTVSHQENTNHDNSIKCNVTRVSRKNICKRMTPESCEKLLKADEKWHERMGHISAPYTSTLR